jgi:hypothetical protein
MRINISIARVSLFVGLSLGIALQGCSLFVSHYDAGAYQYFTSLKAFHIKFLEDNGEKDGKTYDAAKAKGDCDAGELKFREATEYAKGKHDESRVRAFGYLHNAFIRECGVLIGANRYFHTAFVNDEIQNVGPNYDLAIEGEISRVGGPPKTGADNVKH